jgi:hypothetical protein
MADLGSYDSFDAHVKRIAWSVLQFISLAGTLYIAAAALIQKIVGH